RFNYEFPSLIGGAVGLCLSVLIAKYQVGLARTDAAREVGEIADDAEQRGQEDHGDAQGQARQEDERQRPDPVEVFEVAPSTQHPERVLAFAPYLLLIAVLVVTRVRFLPLRTWLNAESPALPLDLGSLGVFSVSVALVFRLESIFGTASAWSYNA